MSARPIAAGARARALNFDGSDTAIAPDRVLAAVKSGAIVVVEGLLVELGFLDPIRDLYLDEIAVQVSQQAADTVRIRGLEHMHEVLEPREIAAMIGALDRRARPLIVPVARGITDTVSGARPGRYWICDRMWIRAQVPYRELARAPELADAPHLQGHLSPVDAHRDFWLTHPPGSLSFWAAVAPITSENGIELFEDLELTRDAPDTTGLRSVRPVLSPGDAVLFDADRLHASVRNESSTTRVSIGTRILPRRRLRYGGGVYWRPFLDSRLVGTRLDGLASARSRLTLAAWRRSRWRRQWNRSGRDAVMPRARR